MCSFKKIKYLNYENLQDIPTDVVNDIDIEILHMKRNLFQRLPNSITVMNNLVELYLESNFLTDLPTDFRLLSSLKILDIKQNKFTRIPQAIYHLPIIEQLNLFNNSIEVIDDEISNLQSLQKLILAKNKLSSLPVSLCFCKNLQLLDLSSNDIEIIPKQIIYLQKLEDLSISYNKVKLIPLNLNVLQNLAVDFYKNRLIYLPVDIFLEYCIQQSQDYMDLSFSKKDILWYLRKEYHLNCIQTSNTILPLTELCCQKITKQLQIIDTSYSSHNIIDNLILLSKNVDYLPNQLRYILSCPVACCLCCDQYLYCSAFYQFLTNELHNWIFDNEEEDFNVLALFCSYHCYQRWMRLMTFREF